VFGQLDKVNEAKQFQIRGSDSSLGSGARLAHGSRSLALRAGQLSDDCQIFLNALLVQLQVVPVGHSLGLANSFRFLGIGCHGVAP
jgi:hypothetical protein